MSHRHGRTYTWRLVQPKTDESPYFDFPILKHDHLKRHPELEGGFSWVGKRVAVYWPTEQRYFPATITAYNPAKAGRGKYTFEYEDGWGSTDDPWDAGTIFLKGDTIDVDALPDWHPFLNMLPGHRQRKRKSTDSGRAAVVEPSPKRRATSPIILIDSDSPPNSPIHSVSSASSATQTRPVSPPLKVRFTSSPNMQIPSPPPLPPPPQLPNPSEFSSAEQVGSVQILQEPLPEAPSPAPPALPDPAPGITRVTRSRSSVVKPAPSYAAKPLQTQVDLLFNKLVNLYRSIAESLQLTEPPPFNVEEALLWDEESCFRRIIEPELLHLRQKAARISPDNRQPPPVIYHPIEPAPAAAAPIWVEPEPTLGRRKSSSSAPIVNIKADPGAPQAQAAPPVAPEEAGHINIEIELEPTVPTTQIESEAELKPVILSQAALAAHSHGQPMTQEDAIVVYSDWDV